MQPYLNIKLLVLFCILIVVAFLFVSHKYLEISFKAPRYLTRNLIYNTIDDEKCDIIKNNFTQYYYVFDGVKYPTHVPLYQNLSINFECLNRQSPLKKIFALNKFYGREDFGYGLGKVEPFLRNHCPITNCELTNDFNKLNESDFVLVSLSDKIPDTYKIKRPPKQRWISVIIESQM